MTKRSDVVRRKYSAVSLPPMRGYVLTSMFSEWESEGVAIDRFPIVGVSVCTEETWSIRGEGKFDQNCPVPDSELLAAGYHPVSAYTSIVPVVLFDPFAWAPEDGDEAEQPTLVHITECEIEFQHPKTVWCTWPESEDDSRLAAVANRMRSALLAERAKKRPGS